MKEALRVKDSSDSVGEFVQDTLSPVTDKVPKVPVSVKLSELLRVGSSLIEKDVLRLGEKKVNDSDKDQVPLRSTECVTL